MFAPEQDRDVMYYLFLVLGWVLGKGLLEGNRYVCMDVVIIMMVQLWCDRIYNEHFAKRSIRKDK